MIPGTHDGHVLHSDSLHFTDRHIVGTSRLGHLPVHSGTVPCLPSSGGAAGHGPVEQLVSEYSLRYGYGNCQLVHTIRIEPRIFHREVERRWCRRSPGPPG